MDIKSLASQLDEYIIKVLLSMGITKPATKIKTIRQRKDYIYIKIELIGDPIEYLDFYSKTPHETYFIIKYYDENNIKVNVVQTVDKWKLKNFKYKQPRLGLRPTLFPLLEGVQPKVAKIKNELGKELK